ncbi:MAG: Mur ligase family protein [bacterium]
MNILHKLLAFFTRKIISKYRPVVIAITGSVGKTSAKEAIFAVVNEGRRVRTSPKNYNNELGVPLTVIGAEAQGRNLFGWLGVFWKAFWLWMIRDKNYPEMLVLEYGADRPGDIEKLMKLVPAKIGVLTYVAPAHIEFFKSIEGVAQEKSMIVSMLPADGFAILNRDNPYVLKARNSTEARVFTYGFDEASEVQALADSSYINWDQVTISSENAGGVGSLIKIGSEEADLKIRGAFGGHSLYAGLAALAVAECLGIDLKKAVAALVAFHPPAGRMHLVPGIKKTVIIDDTYNSSPDAAKRALQTLAELQPETSENKRIAILGDMAELGHLSEGAHREVGLEVASLGIDLLVCVGDKSRATCHGAVEAGMAENQVFEFRNQEEAGRFVQDRLVTGDLILIKGSQSSRMEYVTKELMANPLLASSLLVRQDPEWQTQ